MLQPERNHTSDALPAVTAALNNQCTASGSSFTITATPINWSVYLNL
jgi:hypothetical protein